MNLKRLTAIGLASLLLNGCGASTGEGGDSFETTSVTTVTSRSSNDNPNMPSAPTTAALDLGNFDSSLWVRSDNFSNGGDFMVGWRADHAVYAGSELVLTVDDDGGQCPGNCSLKPFAAGEIRTTSTYGYGTYQVDMQTSNASGTVTTMFTYVDTNTNPNHAAANDEIDIEIPGARSTTMEATYYRHGGTANTQILTLGFDASAAYHTYAIQWLPQSITWFVDGAQIYRVNGNTHTLPTVPGQFILNFWAGPPGWLGPINYTGPDTARYKNASFTPAN